MFSFHKSKVFVAVGLLLLVGVIYVVWFRVSIFHYSEPVICTKDVKRCPNGSYVARTGPWCEFERCSSMKSQQFSGVNWKTTTDTSSGITFQYPETLFTTYIHPVSWPPQVRVVNEPFACIETGVEILGVGKTEKRTVDDRTYCVTKQSEGAAGSIFTTYTYAFPKSDTTLLFTFTLRAVQCANYDNSQRTACEKERDSFDVDSTVDRMARSVTDVY